MTIKFKTSPSTRSKTIILPYFEDDIDFSFIKELTGVDVKGDFTAAFKENALLYQLKNKSKVFLLGLGKKSKESNKLQEAFRHLSFNRSKNWSKSITIDLRHHPLQMAYYCTLGIRLAAYLPNDLKSNKLKNNEYINDRSFQIIHSNQSIKAFANEGVYTAETQIAIMHLVNSPANIKTPEYLAAYAKKSGKANGFSVKILKEKELKKQGLHAILAVGRGSANSSVLIQMEYKPANRKSSKKPQLGLVGKGITFDTGGISIKGASNMHYMKSDMGGAAAVIGAIELAAKLKLDIHIVALVPAAENAVDANSIRPGDVIKSYSGKTIEIIDTDAEGRLVLADGLNYIQKNFQPEVVLDLATLTGSIVRTLGYTAAGLFTTNQVLSNELQTVGSETNERVWPFPMWEDYNSDIASDVADVRNFSGKAVAGAISAAKFLEYFIPEHTAWAHLDIAGVAFGDSDYTKMKSASGYGVRLLVAYMKKLIQLKNK